MGGDELRVRTVLSHGNHRTVTINYSITGAWKGDTRRNTYANTVNVHGFDGVEEDMRRVIRFLLTIHSQVGQVLRGSERGCSSDGRALA